MPTAQAMSALQRANNLRSAMADLKREARDHGASWLALRLEVSDPILARLRVGAILCSLPRYGPERARKILLQAELPRSSYEWRVGPLYEQWTRKTDRTLTTRQRLSLSAALTENSHH